MESKRHFFTFLLVILLLVGVFFVPFSRGRAFFGPSGGGGGGGGGISLGGIEAVIPCLCSKNTLLIVGPPKGGMFIFQPGSSKLLVGSLSEGNWVLGMAGGGSVCLQPAFKICIPVGAGPVITFMGTS